MIEVKPFNEVFVKVNCDPSEAQELSEHFTFEAPGAKFHPLVRNKVWDGKIRLFNTRNRLLYRGLVPYVEAYAHDNEYNCSVEDPISSQCEFSLKEANDFIATLSLPPKLESRDYQVESFVHCVRHNRALFISPTGSGKSLIIYLLTRYYNCKTLIIIDSLNLLKQMASDFADYGYDVSNIHLISAGQDKTSKKPIFITTWQSAMKQPKAWFDQFKLVIGDEAHQYDAKCLKHIMESLTDCKYRFGFTGTLNGAKANKLVLEGLFGPYKKIVSTKELIDQGYLSKLKIKCIVLKYPDDIRKKLKKDMSTAQSKYQTEIDFLYDNEKRNKFIKNLALSLKGNTLLLFQRIEQHGVPLYDAIKAESKVPTYYVAGSVDSDEREEIRKIVNVHNTSICVASVGTFAKGVNIPRIHNIIMASPSKSQIRVLQSIGRGLRVSADKYICTLFDIADDLCWKNWHNYTYKHHAERIKMYVTEDFEYKLYPVEIK